MPRAEPSSWCSGKQASAGGARGFAQMLLQEEFTEFKGKSSTVKGSAQQSWDRHLCVSEKLVSSLGVKALF